MIAVWQWHELDPEMGNLTPPQRVFNQCWFWYASDDLPPEWMPHLWFIEDEWREMGSNGDTCVMRYYPGATAPAPQEEQATCMMRLD